MQTEMEKLIHKLDKKDEDIQNVKKKNEEISNDLKKMEERNEEISEDLKKMNEDMFKQLNMKLDALSKEKH